MPFVKHPLATLLLPLGLLACALSHAQDAVPSGTRPAVNQNVSPASANTTTNNEGPNAMTRAVVQRGVLNCAARVQQVSQFLGFGPQAGGMIMATSGQVDQRLFSMQMELPAGASGNTYVDMTFAPNQANGCGATYQSVSFMAQSCETAASGPYAQFKRLQAIKQDVTVLDGGPSTKVFLMKAGDSGCIAIKKEIVV